MTVSRPTILLFGDSITQDSFDVGGWGALLAHAYRRRCNILNYGFSGWNTRMALAIVDEVYALLGGQRALFTCVFFGANDSAVNAAQHVPPAEFSSNIAAIVNKALAASPVVVVVTPPPVDTTQWPTRNNGAVQLYTTAVREVVSSLSVPEGKRLLHLDLFAAMTRSSPYDSYLSDGLHLSADGSSVVFHALMDLLTDRAPECLPDAVRDPPTWRELADHAGTNSTDWVAKIESPDACHTYHLSSAGVPDVCLPKPDGPTDIIGRPTPTGEGRFVALEPAEIAKAHIAYCQALGTL